MDLFKTSARWRSRLPHWEVEGHWHFVTIRCQGSLPLEAIQKIKEIHAALKSVNPQSQAALQLQRRYFLTMEKYLDAALGFAPFLDPSSCRLCLGALEKMKREGWFVGEAVIMPNHVHRLIFRHESFFSMKHG